MIRALIFDCFGVLYSEGKSHVKNLCPPEKKDELQSLYLQADYGYISFDEFITQTSQLLDISETELGAIISQHYVRNQPIIDYVRRMKADYKIGLLSNTGDTFLDTLITKEERDELFDVTVLSSSVGIIKPSVEIYNLIVQRLGVLPDECIMIDDIPRNVEGAITAGMHGVLFTSNHQLELDINSFVGTHGA